MVVSIQPIIMAEWIHRGAGVKYDERYWNDPEYRRGQDSKIEMWLHKNFPKFFPLSPLAKTTTFNIGIGQTFIVTCGLFGGGIRYFENYNPDVSCSPLKDAATVEQIKLPDIENTWPISFYLDQYAHLTAKYSVERVNLLGFIRKVEYPNYGTFTEAWASSPLTTAYKLRGEQIFIDIFENPKLARHLIDIVTETHLRLLDLLAKKGGVTINLVNIACCTASFLSAKIFGEWDLPAMTKLMKNYGNKGAIHSCGSSSHILNELIKLPELVMLELGEGTDMKKARGFWPRSRLRYILDTYKLICFPKTQISEKIRRVIEEAGSGPLTIQIPAEWGTPREILDAVYDTVLEHNKKEHGIDLVDLDIVNRGIST